MFIVFGSVRRHKISDYSKKALKLMRKYAKIHQHVTSEHRQDRIIVSLIQVLDDLRRLEVLTLGGMLTPMKNCVCHKNHIRETSPPAECQRNFPQRPVRDHYICQSRVEKCNILGEEEKV